MSYATGPARRAPAPLLLAVLALAACGGGGSQGTVGGTLPLCANAGEAIALPPEVDTLPLPAGSVIDASRRDAVGNTIFAGFVPGDLEAVRDYFNAELPRHGYELGEGDAEEHEAETEFMGHGVEAHMKLRDVSGCKGAIRLELALL